MEKVHTVDILGEQWEIQDKPLTQETADNFQQVADQLQTDEANIQTNADDIAYLKENTYITKQTITAPTFIGSRWIRIRNAYPSSNGKSTMYKIRTSTGLENRLFCLKDTSGAYVNPIWMGMTSETSTKYSMFYQNGEFYLQATSGMSYEFQVISGEKQTLTLSVQTSKPTTTKVDIAYII